MRGPSRHYYSRGGASKVVANLGALKPKAIRVIGVVGNDIFGRELRRQFDDLGIDTTHLIIQYEHFDTVTFGKPYLEDVEEPRIDFGFFNKRSPATDQALLQGIGTRHQRPCDRQPAGAGSIANEFHRAGNRVLPIPRRPCCAIRVTMAGSSGTSRRPNDRAARLNDVRSGAIRLCRRTTCENARKLYRQFQRRSSDPQPPRHCRRRCEVHEVPASNSKLDPSARATL
jgi:hypothetical protein